MPRNNAIKAVGECLCDGTDEVDEVVGEGYHYEDGFAREHSEMIKKIEAYEKDAKARLDASVTVYANEKHDQRFLADLIPVDRWWYERFNYSEVLEVIKTLEVTLEMIKIMEGAEDHGFATWSRRHAA